jgi:hypothetical protein
VNNQKHQTLGLSSSDTSAEDKLRVWVDEVLWTLPTVDKEEVVSTARTMMREHGEVLVCFEMALSRRPASKSSRRAKLLLDGSIDVFVRPPED